MAAGTSATDWLERAAVSASALCLAHCLALPILFALAPSLSSALSIPEGIHLWLLAAAVPMAGAALLQGGAVHEGVAPLLIGLAGLMLMAAGALVWGETSAETPMTVADSKRDQIFAPDMSWEMLANGPPDRMWEKRQLYAYAM